LKSKELMNLYVFICLSGKVKSSRRKNGKQHVSRSSRTINQLAIATVMGHNKMTTKLHLGDMAMQGIKEITNRTMIAAIVVCPKWF